MALLPPPEVEHPSSLLLLHWYPGMNNGEKLPNILGATVDTSPNVVSPDNGCSAATSPKFPVSNVLSSGENAPGASNDRTSPTPTSQGINSVTIGGRKRKRILEEEKLLKRYPPSSANERRNLATSTSIGKWPGLPQNMLPLPPDHTLIREQADNSANQVKHALEFCYKHRQSLKSKGKIRRPDLATWNYMREHGLLVNRERRSGEVPGVPVGFRFFYRVELAVVGMHFALQSGIDTRLDGDSKSVATSAIMSGGYEDCIFDNGERLEYTGQGGAYHKSDRGAPDQKLCGANMAMFQSFQRGYPIRLVRGQVDDRSPSNTTYTYYGMYRITGMEQKRGPKGNNTYSFHMTRLPNQAPLTFLRRNTGSYPSY